MTRRRRVRERKLMNQERRWWRRLHGVNIWFPVLQGGKRAGRRSATLGNQGAVT